MENMISNEIDKALHTCGYRYVSSKDDVHTYGKPLGYGILRADVSDDNTMLSVSLIVEGNMEHGQLPNSFWVKINRSIISSPDEDKYLTCVQAIKDNEAAIFANTPVAFSNNRFVRYDFGESYALAAVLEFCPNT